jgi:predicted secreted protein
MQIRVRAIHEAQYPPERGTVHLIASLEGHDKSKVVASVLELLSSLTDKVRAGHRPDKGPITWFSQGQLRNTSQRPWNQDGKQLPLVHTSTAEMKVKFSDFAALFGFVEEVTAWAGVRVLGVDWALTEAYRVRVTEDAEREAVRAAAAKAKRYALAAGYEKVRFVRVADTGLLVEGITPSAQGEWLAGAATRSRGGGGAGNGPGQSFAPEDVKIRCSVDAEFLAEQDGSGPV